MQSNVGNSQVYEAGDQRTYKDSEIEQAKKEARFHEGKENSHKALDSSTSSLSLPPSPPPLLTPTPTEDERSIANKLEREEKREKEDEPMSLEDRQAKQDATLPARAHGNEPSKGAKIDQQLREEEEAELKAKGKA
jgi:hypothetical protein